MKKNPEKLLHQFSCKGYEAGPIQILFYSEIMREEKTHPN